jgi:D-alanyl-D-alanine carboxypeptidase (penicillin-binding protein 5/6)
VNQVSVPRIKFKQFLAILLLAAVALGVFSYTRPLPLMQPQHTAIPSIAAQNVNLLWLGTGQAAIGAVGFGVLATNQTSRPVPMASVAKIITALAVLKQKPLALGQQGPTITFDSTDISYYQTYASQGGSVAMVVDGETISEYQVLQTMILPSANNVAESLARWAFGSPEAYVTYANQFAKDLGMTQTTVSDASGFSPTTTSSAKDLVILGEAAMSNPVLAQIVGQSQAAVPVAGEIKSTNWLLGSDGFVGIKTGNTDEAGGCYLFATSQTVGTQNVTIVGAIMDAPSLQAAINGGQALADAAKSNFSDAVAVKSGQIVGAYKLPWSGTVEAVAQNNLSTVTWRGTKITPLATLNPLKATTGANSQVGALYVSAGQKTITVPVVIRQAIPKPPLKWRLLRF